MNAISSLYTQKTDEELIALILQGDEDAYRHLILERYIKDVNYYVHLYYNDQHYCTELLHYLYIQLKGDNGDWTPLASYSGKSSFRTWICRVISNLFLEKRKDLIGFTQKSINIDDVTDYSDSNVENNERRIILIEAISMLKNPDYKFILIKELYGYKPKEIRIMLEKKRRQEGRLLIDHTTGKEVIPSIDYIYMIKSRALRDVKMIMKNIEEGIC